MSKDMSHVREVLFDTLDKLRNKQIDIETAKSIQDVSQTLLNSARLELDFLKHSENVKSKFFDSEEVSNAIEEQKAKQKQMSISANEDSKEGIDKTLEEIEGRNGKPYEFKRYRSFGD
jgi:hypothetical protein